QLLRDGGADLRVGLVVLAHHLEGHRLAVHRDHLLLVGDRDGERHAVLVVLAQVRDAARQRAGVGDGDDGTCGGGGRGGLLGLRLFLLAAGAERERERDGQGELLGAIHGTSPNWGFWGGTAGHGEPER